MSDKIKDLALEPINIDLNKLFSLSFDNLKSFMTSLLDNQKVMTNKINELNKKIKNEIEQNKKFHAFLINIDKKQKTTNNTLNKLKKDFTSINKNKNIEKQTNDNQDSKENKLSSDEEEKKSIEEKSLSENEIENYYKGESSLNENELKIIKEKIENLEKKTEQFGISPPQNLPKNAKNANEPLLNFSDGDNDVQLMKLEIRNLKMFNEEMRTKFSQLQKTVEDISVKTLDMNLYDLLKECTLTDSTVDAAKLLVLNLEQKINKKTGIIEDKTKKNEEDMYKLKIECQNIKNLSEVIDHNLKDFKTSIKDVNSQIHQSNEMNTNMVNEMGSKLNETFRKILQKTEEEKSNNKKFLEKIKLDIKNIKSKNANTDTINSNDLESGVSDKDLKLLSDLNKKIIEIEKQIKILTSLTDNTKRNEEISRIEKELSSKIDKKELELINEKLNSHNTNINNLTESLEHTNEITNKNNKDLNLFLGKIENLSAAVSTLKMAIETISGMKSEQIIDTSQYLDTAIFEQFIIAYQKENEKNEKNFETIQIIIKEIAETMKKKVNDEDMKNFEILFNNRLEELKLMCGKKFSDKTETSKNIKFLDQQIKYLLDIYVKSNDKKDNINNNNWLIAKKPIGGFSCVACENYLGDLKNDGNFVAWNKYPKKDKEKNYRVGNGFSRMLNMLNLDIKSTFDGLKDNNYESDDEFRNTVTSKRHMKTFSNNIISLNKGINKNFNNSNMLPKVRNNSENNDNGLEENSVDILNNESGKMAATCTNKIRGDNKKSLSPHIVKVFKKNK